MFIIVFDRQSYSDTYPSYVEAGDDFIETDKLAKELLKKGNRNIRLCKVIGELQCNPDWKIVKE